MIGNTAFMMDTTLMVCQLIITTVLLYLTLFIVFLVVLIAKALYILAAIVFIYYLMAFLYKAVTGKEDPIGASIKRLYNKYKGGENK